MSLYLGIDLGTSGCRVVVIDDEARIRSRAVVPWPPPALHGAESEQSPGVWWESTLQAVGAAIRALAADSIRALAVDGTSASLLLADDAGVPLGNALMYNDARSRAEAERIASVAPAASGAHGPTSSLAKLLRLHDANGRARHALHQADWIAGRLCGRFGVSDENNALKLGYDPVARKWPDWLSRLAVRDQLLPSVVTPGRFIACVAPDIAARFGLRRDTRVIAGTTDSVAAFIATGAESRGDAVTSLGSTLVLKLLSEEPVFAPQYGVYSHRLKERWLAGGASNTGGAVLLKHFTVEELETLAPLVEPMHPTGLDYYPLPEPGERFPLSDPDAKPRLTPRPESRSVFYQAMLEGMAGIEQRGYELLRDLGAPQPARVLTVGGGAVNEAWRRIRERRLGVPVSAAMHQEAAYGAALLARQGAAG